LPSQKAIVILVVQDAIDVEGKSQREMSTHFDYFLCRSFTTWMSDRGAPLPARGRHASQGGRGRGRGQPAPLCSDAIDRDVKFVVSVEPGERNAFTVTASIAADARMEGMVLDVGIGGAGTGWRVWGPPGSAAIAKGFECPRAGEDPRRTASRVLGCRVKRPQDHLEMTGDAEVDMRLRRWAQYHYETPSACGRPFLDRLEREVVPYGTGDEEEAKRDAICHATRGRVELRFRGIAESGADSFRGILPPRLVRGETRRIVSGYSDLERDFNFFPDCNEHLIGFRTAIPIPQDGDGSLVKSARKK
jgi:hypothetical protein